MGARALNYLPSFLNLQRRIGSDPARDFIELGFPNLNITVWDDDFQGDLFRGGAAPGVYQSTASGANSAVAAINTGVASGVIRLDPGDANNGRSDLSLGLHYRGNLNATLWGRFTLDNGITSAKFEIGFTDTVSGTDAGAVNSKSGNTWNATDATVLCFDTSDDTNVTLMGVATGSAATAIDLSFTLTSAAYYWYGVALQIEDKTSDTVRAKGLICDTDGKKVAETAWMTSAVAPTVNLTPWVFIQNRSAAQRTLDLDRLIVYQRRTTGS